MTPRPATLEQFANLLIEHMKMPQELAEMVAKTIWEEPPSNGALPDEPYLAGLCDGIVVSKLLLDSIETGLAESEERRLRRRSHLR